jgi:hypothetical protein
MQSVLAQLIEGDCQESDEDSPSARDDEFTFQRTVIAPVAALRVIGQLRCAFPEVIASVDVAWAEELIKRSNDPETAAVAFETVVIVDLVSNETADRLAKTLRS